MILLSDHLLDEAISYLTDYADEMEAEAENSAGIENVVLGDCSSAEKNLHRAGDIRRIIKSLQDFQTISTEVLGNPL